MKTIFPVLLLSLSFILAGCQLFNKSQSGNSDIVGSVDGTPVTLSDLKASFFNSPVLNDADQETKKQELVEFLDLYIDYRTKLAVANDAGYFDMDEIQRELHQYQMQTVYPYWLENRLRDQLLDEMVERAAIERHVSHILISVPDNALPADTSRAYNRLMEARSLYLSGEKEFSELAEEYSSRQQGRSMGGDLGFISAGWAVKPFEDVAYTTETDSVSLPFRTQFGYHVVKVHEVREKQPDRNFSHIFFRMRGEGFSVPAAQARADEAYQELIAGSSWDQVVQDFTEDEESKPRNGNIGWLEPARYQPLFVENVMSIEEQGTFSEPFQSEYGVHIVRLDSIRTYTSDQQLRDELYERLRSLPRYRNNKETTLDIVRNRSNHEFVGETYTEFMEVISANADANFPNISFEDSLTVKQLFKFENEVYTVQDYINYIGEILPSQRNRMYNNNFLVEFKNHITEKHIIPATKKEFPEFETLSLSYLEGLAVFKVTEDSVWTYSAQDTTALRTMFDANPDSYQLDTRYRFYRFSADSDSVLINAKDLVHSGMEIDSLRNEIPSLIIRTDIINSLVDFPFDMLSGLSEGEFSEIFEFRNRPSMMYLTEILEPRNMTFDEAYMRIASEYQPIREQTWMQKMRERYRAEADHDQLRRLLQNIDL